MRSRNPFVTQGYIDPAHFCDREVETRQLLDDLSNGRHVTLMAPRRYGKSGLIQHALRTPEADCVFVYADLLATTNQADFVRVFANAVVGALDSRLEKAASTFAAFFKSVRPKMKADSDGGVSFSFEVAETSSEATLEQVFDYLAKKRSCEIVVALDEFQQVAFYPEKGTEALLRSRIQFMPPNVHFVFAGSQMHLMGEIFASPKRPFYQSTTFLTLDVISKETYRTFAARFFADDHRAFAAEAFDALYDRFDGITWYVQAVLNEVWATGGGLTDVGQVERAVANLVQRRSLTFHDLDVSQSDSARTLLRAVASAGPVAAPTAADFIAQSGLRAPSTVAGALKQLLANELLYKTPTGYVVYDRLFGEYLRNCP